MKTKSTSALGHVWLYSVYYIFIPWCLSLTQNCLQTFNSCSIIQNICHWRSYAFPPFCSKYKCYRYCILGIIMSHYFSFYFEEERMFKKWMSYLEKENSTEIFGHIIVKLWSLNSRTWYSSFIFLRTIILLRNFNFTLFFNLSLCVC